MLIGWHPKSDDSRVASVRFRYQSPMDELRAHGFPIERYREGRPYDLIIFSKLYNARDQVLARKLQAEGRRVVLDLSDNHFYNPFDLPAYHAAARDLRAMIDLVDRVYVCSQHLGEIVSAQARPRLAPLLVEDAVEEHFAADSEPVASRDDKPFSLLWFGSHGSPNAPAGLEDVLRLNTHFERARETRPVELTIVSNNIEKFAERIAPRLSIPSRYVEWTSAAFATALRQANACVIPINANPFTLCKSNNRVATSLWHGIPVLADAIPAYEELRPYGFLDDWANGFANALTHSDEIKERTSKGQRYVRQRFNISAIAVQWRHAIETTLADAQHS